MDREHFGICSSCQSRAPVREVSRYEQWNDDFAINEYDDDAFVMADHDAFGKGCSGSGMTPKVILGT
jgi:hypothetical protein